MFCKDLYLPLEIQRIVFEKLMKISESKLWNRYMRVNSTWFNEIAELVYEAAPRFYGYWGGRPSYHPIIQVGTPERFEKVYAKFAKYLAVDFGINFDFIYFDSPWIKEISFIGTTKPELWIKKFLKSSSLLERVKIITYSNLQDGEEDQLAHSLKSLGDLFDLHEHPIDIKLAILLEHFEVYAQAPSPFLKKVSWLSLVNAIINPETYYVFTRLRTDLLLRFTSLRHFEILCEFITDRYYPDLTKFLQQLDELVIKYDSTPEEARLGLVDYVCQLKHLKKLVLLLDKNLFDLNGLLSSKRFIQWGNVADLELHFEPEWFRAVSTDAKKSAIKKLLDHFPYLRNLFMYVSNPRWKTLIGVNRSLCICYSRELCSRGGEPLVPFRTTNKLVDFTPFLLPISQQCRALETLQLDGAMVNIKSLWQRNKKLLKNIEKNEKKNIVMFPRLVLLEVDKVFDLDFMNEDFNSWKYKHLRYCAYASSNYYY